MLQPHFAAVLGEVPFCEEAAVAAGADKSAAVAAAKKAIAAANKGGAAKGGDKKEKAKAEEKPKAAKKEEKPKKEKDEDAPPPMMDIPKEEKKKDPLAELPKSSMNLDEWKRHYSNTKPHIGAMPWFWEKLDREGWSLWKQDYNYNTGESAKNDERRRLLSFLSVCLSPPHTFAPHALGLFRPPRASTPSRIAQLSGFTGVCYKRGRNWPGFRLGLSANRVRTRHTRRPGFLMLSLEPQFDLPFSRLPCSLLLVILLLLFNSPSLPCSSLFLLRFLSENTRDFMTSNLVGGFIQRSDEVRRYAFGQMYVLNPPADAEASKKFYEVTGMWLMRGHSIQPMLDSNPDAEYYTWKKMNPEDAADRTLVEAYWAEPAPEESLLGKVVYDSRVFK